MGKNTLLNAVLPEVPGLRYSVSATTRPPRPGEVHGRDYFFVTDEEFDDMVRRDRLLEWAEFVGRRYGTPRDYIERCLAEGSTVIMDIDIQGARQIRERMKRGDSGVSVAAQLAGAEPPHPRAGQRFGGRHYSAPVVGASGAFGRYRVRLRHRQRRPGQGRAELRSIITAERCRVSRTDFQLLTKNMGPADHP